MTFGMFMTWVAAGLVTGWLAGFVIRDGGRGRVHDLILGLSGSGVLSTAAATVGAVEDASGFGMAALAIVGAALAIISQRKIWPAPSPRS